MNIAKIRSLGEIVVPGETRDLMTGVYDQWKGRIICDTADINCKKLYDVNPRSYTESGMLYDAVDVSLGSDYASHNIVLTEGVRDMLEGVEQGMNRLRHQSGDYRKLAFLQGVKIILEALVKWTHRYVDLYEETAAEENGAEKETKLLETVEICRWVPENPARDFREAIQSYWFMYLLAEVERVSYADSLGHFGQFMYPLYKRDIEEGRITHDKASRLIYFLFIRHTRLGTYSGMAHQKALSKRTGQILATGGLVPDGKDANDDYEMTVMEV